MIILIFAIIALGIYIGKFKILHVRIGSAGVLLLSFMCGKIIASFTEYSIANTKPICDFLSSMGMPLFISAIGLVSGSALRRNKIKTVIRSLSAGIVTTLAGLGITAACLVADTNVNKNIFLGIFCGSMTSTPAMSEAISLTGNGASITLGYSIAYIGGLLSTILFVQFFAPANICEDRSGISKTDPKNASLLFLSIPIALGHALSYILPIGNTACILILSMIIGAIFFKKQEMADHEAYKELGLILFMIGVGIPAGMLPTDLILWRYILYGALISLLSLFIGYLSARYIFRFNTSNALSVLCGGMTSTPAIGALTQIDKSADLSLYTISYIGSLFTVIFGVRGLVYFI